MKVPNLKRSRSEHSGSFVFCHVSSGNSLFLSYTLINFLLIHIIHIHQLNLRFTHLSLSTLSLSLSICQSHNLRLGLCQSIETLDMCEVDRIYRWWWWRWRTVLHTHPQPSNPTSLDHSYLSLSLNNTLSLLASNPTHQEETGGDVVLKDSMWEWKSYTIQKWFFRFSLSPEAVVADLHTIFGLLVCFQEQR